MTKPSTSEPAVDQESEPVKPPYYRDRRTGLVACVEYKRLPNGRIDWKSMINPAHIVFNSKADKELTELYGATADKLVYSEVIKTKAVDDKHILILLAGFVELADLRGYTSIHSDIAHVTAGANASVACHITWLPNEEEPYAKTSFGTADATMENTGGFGYLAAIAGNRAFVRAVKNGLGIFVLGFDEIAKKDMALPESAGGSSAPVNPLSPQGTLQKAAEDLKYTFDLVRKGAIKYKDKMKSTEEEIGKWKGFADVPPPDCMSLIGLLRKKEEKPAAE
jgi:hypothetical protein